MIAQIDEWGATGQVLHHGVVFHFAKADQVNRSVLVCCSDDFSDVFEFLEQSPFCPMAVAFSTKLKVVFTFVVDGVEGVFDVVGKDGEGVLGVGVDCSYQA